METERPETTPENRALLRAKAALDRAKSVLEEDDRPVQSARVPPGGARRGEESRSGRRVVQLITVACVIFAFGLLALHYRGRISRMKNRLADMSADVAEMRERNVAEIARLRAEMAAMKSNIAEQKVEEPRHVERAERKDSPREKKRKKFLWIF